MDLGSGLIGGLAIVLIALPFLLIRRNQNKNKAKMYDILNALAQQHETIIEKFDLAGNFIIGTDPKHEFVFFFKKGKDEEVIHQVDLKEIENCKVVKKDLLKGNYKTVERLELVFVPKDKSQLETYFEIFNIEQNMQLNGELQVVDRWKVEINSWLRK
ncbi:MAG: hypothetical protein R2784_03720 [Saprospiraceae bacterium]